MYSRIIKNNIFEQLKKIFLNMIITIFKLLILLIKKEVILRNNQDLIGI